MTFLSIVMLVFGILEIILFFKIWVMTNDVHNLMNYVVYNIPPKNARYKFRKNIAEGIAKVNFNELKGDFMQDEDAKRLAKLIFDFYKGVVSPYGYNEDELNIGVNERIARFEDKIKGKGLNPHDIADMVIEQTNELGKARI